MQLDRKVLAFGQLPSSKGDLYVPASGRKGYAHNLTLHNTNTTSEDVVLNYHDGASEHEILSETIPAGDSLYLQFPGEGEVVGIGGKFTGNTTTASKVTFKFSGTEEIPDTVQDDIIWEWNGVDITQFGDGAGTPDEVSGSPNGVLSVGAVPASGVDVPTSNVLLYTPGSNTGGNFAHFLVNDLPPLPERYIVRARTGPKESTCNPAVNCMYQDKSHRMGWGWGGSSGLHAFLFNNVDGTTAGHFINNTSLPQTNVGLVVEVDCLAVEPSSGVDPKLAMLIQECRYGIAAYGKGGPTSWSSWGSPPAIYDASWQSGGTLRKFGIQFSNNGVGTAAWIGELQILRHPWQKVV